MKQNKQVIGEAKPHSIKKFELIENYVEKWARILLNYIKSEGIIYIDCMCNAGVYYDENGNLVEGTAVRVIKKLNQINAGSDKAVKIYLNDIDEQKIEYLESVIQGLNTANIDIKIDCKDANLFLRQFDLSKMQQCHSLLFYDPFDASIDWKAIDPFLNRWGEVIVNHMVSDSVRNIKTAKNPETINKYMKTYECHIDKLIKTCTSKEEFEKLIFNAMKKHAQTFNKECYLSTIPFYIKTNQLIYNLIFFTRSLKGFGAFKTAAWNTFDCQSSNRSKNNISGQLGLDFNNLGTTIDEIDDHTYNLSDIAAHLYTEFKGKGAVSREEIFSSLEYHPIFPSDLHRREICKLLKENFAVKVGRSEIYF